MEQHEPWNRDNVFSWLPEDGLETLGACFDLTTEYLKKGEIRIGTNRVAYLLRGTILTNQKEIPAGTLLGIAVTERGEKRSVPVTLEALEDSELLWFDFELLRTVCYAACWFHVRFLKEIDRLLEQ